MPGIKGGQVYGSFDATGADYDRLGIDPTKEYHTPTGRPVKRSNNGTPIRSPLV